MALVYRQVAVGQRPAGSPQLRHLATELRPKLPDGTFEPFATPGPQQGLRNIIGVLPGRPPAILIGAHYDTEWHPRGFVGANDSAAGTAAVIELARSLRSALPADHREIRFVLFDGQRQHPAALTRTSSSAPCAAPGPTPPPTPVRSGRRFCSTTSPTGGRASPARATRARRSGRSSARRPGRSAPRGSSPPAPRTPTSSMTTSPSSSRRSPRST